MSYNHKGLTLIEMIVVVGLIGILAALAIPRFMKVQSRAKASEALGMLKAALVLEKAYWNHYGRYSDGQYSIWIIDESGIIDELVPD
jgi:prepilin-type N-terminal cleavage/methylation domain-containing protein